MSIFLLMCFITIINIQARSYQIFMNISAYLVSKDEYFEDDSPDARKGKLLLSRQLTALQEVRGHLEKCKQKRRFSSSEIKIQKLWTNAKIGLFS